MRHDKVYLVGEVYLCKDLGLICEVRLLRPYENSPGVWRAETALGNVVVYESMLFTKEEKGNDRNMERTIQSGLYPGKAS